MFLELKTYLKSLGIAILWVVSILLLLLVLIGVPMKVHLDAKIHQYNFITEVLERTPLTEVGYLINKYHIIEYNAWLAYWQKLDQLPIIEIFIPDKIQELKPIVLKPWVSYSIPGVTSSALLECIEEKRKAELKKVGLLKKDSTSTICVIRGTTKAEETIK